MQVLRKTMENLTTQRDIKLVTTERRSYLVSQQNYKKTEIIMNKPVYLRLSILELKKNINL